MKAGVAEGRRGSRPPWQPPVAEAGILLTDALTVLRAVSTFQLLAVGEHDDGQPDASGEKLPPPLLLEAASPNMPSSVRAGTLR